MSFLRMCSFTLIILSLFCCSLAQDCTPVPVQQNFNLTAFTSAPWYAQMGQPVAYLTKDELYCVLANYTLTGPSSVDVFNYANKDQVNGEVHEGNLCAVVPNSAEPAKLEVGLCLLPTMLYGPYWVVLAGPSPQDYQYALISGGQPTINTGNGCRTGSGVNGSGLWIFSRTPVAPEEQIELVLQQARSYGYDTSVLLPIEQKGCVYPSL